MVKEIKLRYKQLETWERLLIWGFSAFLFAWMAFWAVRVAKAAWPDDATELKEAPDSTADFLVLYDDSASVIKKITPQYIGGSDPTVTTGITATSPGVQGDSPLTSTYNQITTVASDGDAVTLPTASAGLTVWVANEDSTGNNRLEIWPASGDDLGQGVDTALRNHQLKVNRVIRFDAIDATTWYPGPTMSVNGQALELYDAAGSVSASAIIALGSGGVGDFRMTHTGNTSWDFVTNNSNPYINFAPSRTSQGFRVHNTSLRVSGGAGATPTVEIGGHDAGEEALEITMAATPSVDPIVIRNNAGTALINIEPDGTIESTTNGGGFKTIAGGDGIGFGEDPTSYNEIVSGGGIILRTGSTDNVFVKGRSQGYAPGINFLDSGSDTMGSVAIPWQIDTTDATTTEMAFKSNGSDTTFGIASGDSYAFEALVIARRTDAADVTAGWILTGTMANVGGTTSIVGTVDKRRLDVGPARQQTFEAHTLAAAASSDTTTISIPSGAELIGVGFHVTTTVVDDAGDDTWSAAFITGSTTTLATGAAAAAGTKVSTMLASEITSGVAEVRFTPNGGNFSAGVIDVLAQYRTLPDISDSAAWDVDVIADDTTDALEIEVTGEASQTIIWNAQLKLERNET